MAGNTSSHVKEHPMVGSNNINVERMYIEPMGIDL